jgi:hypothetical protein
MTSRQRERLELHQKLNRLEDETPEAPAYRERLEEIRRLRQQLNDEAEKEGAAEEREKLKGEFINPKTGKPESFKDRTERIAREQQGNRLYISQRQQREIDRQARQDEQKQVKLNQDDIVAACIKNGSCKVTIDDIKNAFPKIISKIDGNAYRTQIDNKQFQEWLAVNGLTFTLPDFVFRSRKID